MKKQSPAHLPTPEEDTRIEMYREIVDDMLDAYQEQYHDYGRGYAEARRKIPCYIAGKLYDKVSQLIALSRDGGPLGSATRPLIMRCWTWPTMR